MSGRVTPSSLFDADGRHVCEARLRLATDRVGIEAAGAVARPGMTVGADGIGDLNSILAYRHEPLRVLFDRPLAKA